MQTIFSVMRQTTFSLRRQTIFNVRPVTSAGRWVRLVAMIDFRGTTDAIMAGLWAGNGQIDASLPAYGVYRPIAEQCVSV